MLSGLPHSDTHGSMLICSSPWLFAACRVLLRLPVPRHSPCALLSLNFMSFANLFRSKCSFFFTVLVVVFLPWLNSQPFPVLLFCHLRNISIAKTRFASQIFILFSFQGTSWLAQVGSNHRPRAYQARALACWAMSQSLVLHFSPLVEMKRFELLTPCLQGRCSPNWATPPGVFSAPDFQNWTTISKLT